MSELEILVALSAVTIAAATIYYKYNGKELSTEKQSTVKEDKESERQIVTGNENTKKEDRRVSFAEVDQIREIPNREATKSFFSVLRILSVVRGVVDNIARLLVNAIQRIRVKKNHKNSVRLDRSKKDTQKGRKVRFAEVDQIHEIPNREMLKAYRESNRGASSRESRISTRADDGTRFQWMIDDEFNRMIVAQKQCQTLADSFQDSKGVYEHEYSEAKNEGEKRILHEIIKRLETYKRSQTISGKDSQAIDTIMPIIKKDLKVDSNHRQWSVIRDGTSIRKALQNLEFLLGVNPSTEEEIQAGKGEFELYRKMKSMDQTLNEISTSGQINQEMRDSSSSMLTASIIMKEANEAGFDFMCNNNHFTNMAQEAKECFINKFRTKGEVCAPFVFLIQDHYISGALYRSQSGKYSLSCLDQMDPLGRKGEEIKKYIESSIKEILKKEISISSHNEFDCLVDRDGNEVGIQQDGINCGPLSLEIVDHFNISRCRKIANGEESLNDLVRSIGFIQNDNIENYKNDHQKKVWTNEDAQLSAAGARNQIYAKYGKKFKKCEEKIKSDWHQIKGLVNGRKGPSPQP